MPASIKTVTPYLVSLRFAVIWPIELHLFFRKYLKTPVSNFLQRLVNGGYGSAAMSSPTAIKKYGDDFGNNPIGTVPFKFSERVFGEKIVL